MKKLISLAIFALSLTLSSCDQQNKEDIDDQKLQAENQVEENINQQIKNEKEIEDEKETESEDSIVLEDKDGNPVSLADYKGKKTFVEFWASWCPICLTGLEPVSYTHLRAHET